MGIARELLTDVAIATMAEQLTYLTQDMTGAIQEMDSMLRDDMFIGSIEPPAWDPYIGQQFVDHGAAGAAAATISATDASARATFQSTPLPRAPILGPITDVNTPTMPSAPGGAPAVSFPSKPSLVDPTAPTSPVINEVVIPDAPVLNKPDVPALLDINLPPITPITIPPFDYEFPLLDPNLSVPPERFLYEEPEYTSAELIELRNILIDNLQNGGWGVDHADEEALFDREVDRASRAGVGNENIIVELAGSRGFPTPPGVSIAALRKNQQDTVNLIAEANRDVSITRADLIRKSREHAITSSLTLNQTMVTHFGFAQQRVLDAAKSVVEYSLRVFEAEINLYNTRLASFNAYVAAYESHLRAQVIRLEAEKIQLDAEMAKNEINKVNIDIYNSLIRALSLEIEIFNTEMQAAKITSDIEQSKVQIYATQVNAYDSQIRAEMAKIQLYTAEVSAEGTKVDVYKTEVQAYVAGVSGAKIVADVDIAIGNFDVAAQGLEIEKFRAEIANLRTELDRERARAGIEATQRTGEISTLMGVNDLYQTMNTYELTADEASLRSAIANKEYIRETENAMVARDKIVADLNTERAVTTVEQFRQYFDSMGVFASDITVNTKEIV